MGYYLGVLNVYKSTVFGLNQNKLILLDSEGFTPIKELEIESSSSREVPFKVLNDSLLLYINRNSNPAMTHLYLHNYITNIKTDSIALDDRIINTSISYGNIVYYSNSTKFMMSSGREKLFVNYQINSNKLSKINEKFTESMYINSVEVKKDGSKIVVETDDKLIVYDSNLHKVFEIEEVFYNGFSYAINDELDELIVSEKNYRIADSKSKTYKKYPISKYSLLTGLKKGEIILGAAPLDMIVENQILYSIGKDHGPVILEITEL